MVPVMVLSDGYLANGSEPWLIPDVTTLPDIPVNFRTDPEGFFPYLRDPATLARPWVRPGTPGLEHRIGGIEKQDVTGNISYEPDNHEHMVLTRAEKVRRVAQEIPPTSINGPATGDVLVVGWGGTYGAITAAVEEAQIEGKGVGIGASAPSRIRCRPTSARSSASTGGCWCRRSIAGSSSASCAPSTWSTRSGTTA